MLTFDDLVARDDLNEALLTELIAESDAEHRFDGTILPPGTDGWDAKRWGINDGINATCLVLGDRRRKAATKITDIFRAAQKRQTNREKRIADAAILPPEAMKSARAFEPAELAELDDAVGSRREPDIQRTLSPIEQVALEAELVERRPVQEPVLLGGGAKL